MTRFPLLLVIVAVGSTPVSADTFDDWVKETTALKADDQIAAVRKKFDEHNPLFQGSGEKLACVARDGVVREVRCDAAYVTDIRAFRGFPELEVVVCDWNNTSRPTTFADLSPLTGMKLKTLQVAKTKVANLAPLKGIPLEVLHLNWTPASDVRVLRDMPLRELALPTLGEKNLAQLEFLKDKSLTIFSAKGTQLDSATLARLLAGSKLKQLDLQGNRRVANLDFARGMPLHSVQLDMCYGLMNLDGLAGCEELGSVMLSDSPNPKLSLAPLKGKPLTSLFLYRCPGVRDLTPLKGMTSLTVLDLSGASVTDIGPLEGMEKLTTLGLTGLRLKTLKPLAGMTKLTTLNLEGATVADRNFAVFAKLPLEVIRLDVHPVTKTLDPFVAKVLRTIPTLKTINGQRAENVLK